MNKILIRPLIENDALTSYQWRNDSEVWEFTGSKPDKIITKDVELSWIKRVLNENSSKRFAIVVDDEYVGNVQLTKITDIDAEFHIFIGNKKYWGKGIAKEATYQILSYAKNFLGLSEVILFVNKLNVAAIKAYEKNAFVAIEENGEFIKMLCNLEKLPPPMVSVFCMVYNHEKFISEAIEGFLMQKVNFSTLMVIGEDNSTDNSRNIIMEYANLYPGKFKLLLHDKNIGAKQNQFLVLKECRGKYIAMCEGDDYWTDPHKLQKQVNFLSQNKNYTFNCHRYKVLYQDKSTFDEKTFPIKFIPSKENQKDVIVTKDEYHTNWITQPMTTVFRQESLMKYDIESFFHFRDVHIFYLLLNEGNGICFDWCGGVYRHHSGGSHIGSSKLNRAFEAVKISEELYLFSKDIRFFKIYLKNIIYLLSHNNKFRIEAFKSILYKLSFTDKVKLVMFACRYFFIKK